MGRRPSGDQSLTTEFGSRVRRLREQSSRSQEDLADDAGVHRTFIGRVERGETNATLTTLVRLARALEVDPSQLVEGLQVGE